MFRALQEFLNSKYDPTRPVLLALSGGPDSLALFSLLLEYQKKYSFTFGVAHINHNWRPESSVEVEILRQLCSNVVFHLKTLDPTKLTGNLECACREERLAFFRELCANHNYQAVLLGHHADDNAETLFKRILEGSSLPYLQGIKPETTIDNLTLWRPLLTVTKKQIQQYITQNNLKPFIDSTNFDSKYLRTRLRKILPDLSQQFGKEIVPTLSRLSLESSELHDYLEQQIADIPIHLGPIGSYVDLNPRTLHPIELRFLLKKLCPDFTHALLDQACQHIKNKKTNCQVAMGDKKMIIDRNYIFVLKAVEIPERQPLSHTFGPWHIQFDTRPQNWQAMWSGTIHVNVPPGKYDIGLPDNSLNKKWSNAKIPNFLKSYLPVIWQADKIIRWPSCH